METTERTITEAEERLIAAALVWDELGHFGPAAESPTCCADCYGQTELRAATDAVIAERASDEGGPMD